MIKQPDMLNELRWNKLLIDTRLGAITSSFQIMHMPQCGGWGQSGVKLVGRGRNGSNGGAGVQKQWEVTPIRHQI